MFDLNYLVFQFDPSTRIVHLTATDPVHITTLEQGYQFVEAVHNAFDRLLGKERGYLITNYGKIIIEPDEIKVYAEEVQKVADKYIYPDGIARYGFEVSRITAKMGYAQYLRTNPNLFETREEAFTYIHDLIRRQKQNESRTKAVSRKA